MSFRSFDEKLQFIACFLFFGWAYIVCADNHDYSASGGEWKRDGNSYTHEKATFSGFRYSSDENSSNTYKYEVNPPSGWHFIASKTTFSGGTKIADPTAIYAGIKKVCSAANNPTSFVLEMCGELAKPSNGPFKTIQCDTVSWTASARSDFFYISPQTIITFFNGTQKTFSTKSSEEPGNIISNWSASPTWGMSTNPVINAYSPLNGKGSITIGNGGDWNPQGESYTITAEATINQKSRTAQANLKVIKLTFLTPSGDPVGSPTENNEFVYNDASPGILTINLSVQVTPADMADEIKDGCTFSVGDIEGSTMTWHADNPNGKPKVNNGKLEATVTFTGLPENNSSFGKKTATIIYSGTYGSTTVTQDYEVFFLKDKTNHPQCSSCSDCPNWFFYWREGCVCGIPNNALYDPNASFGWCQPHIDSIIRLGPDAAARNTGPEIYYRKNSSESITVTGTGKGIKCVAETIKHEQSHIEIYKQYRGPTDSDNDGVGNIYEPNLLSIRTDPNDADSYNMAGSYSGYGDNEIRCRKSELTPVGYDIKKDWAYPGCQSKDPFGP